MAGRGKPKADAFEMLPYIDERELKPRSRFQRMMPLPAALLEKLALLFGRRSPDRGVQDWLAAMEQRHGQLPHPLDDNALLEALLLQPPTLPPPKIDHKPAPLLPVPDRGSTFGGEPTSGMIPHPGAMPKLTPEQIAAERDGDMVIDEAARQYRARPGQVDPSVVRDFFQPITPFQLELLRMKDKSERLTRRGKDRVRREVY